MGSKVNKLISVSPSGRMWQKASLLSKKSLAALEPQINPSPRKRSSCGVWDRCFRSATHRLTRMRFEYRAKKSPYYPIIRSPRSWNQCLEDTVVEGNCPHPIEAKNASHDLWFAKRCNVAYVISTGGHKFSCRFSCFRLLSPAPNLLQHAHHNFLCLMASHLQLETKTLWSFFCQRHLWQISPSLKLAQSHSPLFTTDLWRRMVNLTSAWLRAIRQLCRKAKHRIGCQLSTDAAVIPLHLGMSGSINGQGYTPLPKNIRHKIFKRMWYLGSCTCQEFSHANSKQGKLCNGSPSQCNSSMFSYVFNEREFWNSPQTMCFDHRMTRGERRHLVLWDPSERADRLLHGNSCTRLDINHRVGRPGNGKKMRAKIAKSKK